MSEVWLFETKIHNHSRAVVDCIEADVEGWFGRLSYLENGNGNDDTVRSDKDNIIASRILAARPEGSPFAVQGILIF